MNRFYATALAFLLLCPCFLSAKYMAVLETLAPKDLLTTQERLYLTDILRGQAVNILPAEQNWTIMTRENINIMLPPGKKIEDCEGSCLAETGKNIAADYVAQARISQFGKSLAISAELYETASSKLVASFVGKGETVDDIEKIIKEQSPTFFKKVRENSWDGFDYVNTNNSFSFQSAKKIILNIATIPEGAIPSIDGKATPQCTSTPCKIQIEAGEHRLVISKDQFEDLDTLINVVENDQTINLTLSSNLGSLYIIPQFPDEFRKYPLTISIDGKNAFLGQNELIPGPHAVRIEHACFDPVEFNTIIQKQENKTMSDSLIRGLSGLELEVTKNNVPQAVPVFVDGVQVGTTPFASEIPLCARIEIEYDNERKEIPVDFKWHQVTKKTYSIEEKTAAETPKDATAQKVEEASKNETTQKVNVTDVEQDFKKEADETGPKKFWGGLVAGVFYNDFHSTKFGLNSIPQNPSYSLSVQDADKLLDNFWGIGFKVGFGSLFVQNSYFSIRNDIGIAYRQGTGNANTSFIMSWEDGNRAAEKSDLKIEYTIKQLNIDIPLLARVSIPSSLYFEVGPMFSFNVYSKNKSVITDIYGSETYESDGELNAFEFDIATGIGISRNLEKSILDIDLRFVIGLTRISDSKDSPKTWQGQLNITYWFL